MLADEDDGEEASQSRFSTNQRHRSGSDPDSQVGYPMGKQAQALPFAQRARGQRELDRRWRRSPRPCHLDRRG